MPDKDFRWFGAWFVFCAVLGLTMLAGIVTVAIIFLPHLLAMIDRIGK